MEKIDVDKLVGGERVIVNRDIWKYVFAIGLVRHRGMVCFIGRVEKWSLDFRAKDIYGSFRFNL